MHILDGPEGKSMHGGRGAPPSCRTLVHRNRSQDSMGGEPLLLSSCGEGRRARTTPARVPGATDALLSDPALIHGGEGLLLEGLHRLPAPGGAALREVVVRLARLVAPRGGVDL